MFPVVEYFSDILCLERLLEIVIYALEIQITATEEKEQKDKK